MSSGWDALDEAISAVSSLVAPLASMYIVQYYSVHVQPWLYPGNFIPGNDMTIRDAPTIYGCRLFCLLLSSSVFFLLSFMFRVLLFLSFFIVKKISIHFGYEYHQTTHSI